MTATMRMSLKAGEKIYINGAVLQVDRKVSLQFLNNATFLLGVHVLQVEDAITPLRQLYFVAQTLLVDPQGEGDALALFNRYCTALGSAFTAPEITSALLEINEQVNSGNTFAALKQIRGLYRLEDEMITAGESLPALAVNNKGKMDDAHHSHRLGTEPHHPTARCQLGSNS